MFLEFLAKIYEIKQLVINDLRNIVNGIVNAIHIVFKKR